MSSVLQLFPQPAVELPLAGLYLNHRLARLTRPGEPLVYANFINSLDGRIAVAPAGGDGLAVPTAITNPNDWRLFLELMAQAQVVVTSGRYLCEYAQGKAQDILAAPYADPRYGDLQRWRATNNLPPRPALAVLSERLAFPLPAILAAPEQPVLVFTGAQADPARLGALRKRGVEVVVTGDGSGVDGAAVVATLVARGYQLIYSAAGPRVLHALLAGRALDRLYLTTACRVLGGAEFATIVQGPTLAEPYDLQLDALYFDGAQPAPGGQLLACYTTAPRAKVGVNNETPGAQG